MDDDNDININVQRQRPKRPLTAYNIYFSVERQRILDAIPDASGQSGGSNRKMAGRKPHGKIGFAELARDVARKWNRLNDEERRPYVEKAAIEKDRYQREMVRWRQYEQAKQAKEEALRSAHRQINQSTLGASTAQFYPIASTDNGGALQEARSQQSLIHRAPTHAARPSSTPGLEVALGHTQGPFTPNAFIDGSGLSQIGATGTTQFSNPILAQLAFLNGQQQAFLRPSTFASRHPLASTGRIVELTPTLPSQGRPMDASQQEQNSTTEQVNLQGLLDGIDEETRNHFIRSMLNRSPPPPPPR